MKYLCTTIAWKKINPCSLFKGKQRPEKKSHLFWISPFFPKHKKSRCPLAAAEAGMEEESGTWACTKLGPMLLLGLMPYVQPQAGPPVLVLDHLKVIITSVRVVKKHVVAGSVGHCLRIHPKTPLHSALGHRVGCCGKSMFKTTLSGHHTLNILAGS